MPRHSSSGDPEGRRIALSRYHRLNEAGRLAHVLRILLAEAGCESEALSELLREIGEQNRVALQRAKGKIHARYRYKGQVSYALIGNPPVISLYVDESGKSVPEPKSLGP